MKRFKYHPSFLRVKVIAAQIILPLSIFQLIRTLLLPTSFDVVLLILIILVYAGLELEWF